ncbi:nucleotidyltransferase family protein [Pseudoduganella lutea]|uniref:Nucleotidyltransferase family protein n=1 Tax=Pseudoduganella lutea TaxID=321985 RepID=A0A4P6KUS5_9BURK|nr:nucleotidyltransferase family protein [Pseudoduganella lutea]QBE62586.1 nucleotidyltransferase family protein [Pseudoduganella lutea]
MSAAEARCRAIIRACPWLMEALATVRSALPLPACIGAGAIRSAVWDALHGLPPEAPATDIDVVYFDAGDPGSARDGILQATLRQRAPQFNWEVTNQAGVHLWYEQAFGRVIAAHDSLEAAIATWPETATAIAARLASNGAIEFVAPLGFDDLMDMVVRWNPALATREQYLQRITARDFRRRWPKVRVLRP